MAPTFYAVEIETEGRREVSRFFQTKRAAVRWARWWAGRGLAARVMLGGAGGVEVASFPAT